MNKYLILLIAAFTLFGCNDFEEINTNPNSPTEVPSGLLLADPIRIMGNTLYSTFIGGDMGACWSQQWSKVQYNIEARYQPRQTILESVWDNFYASSLDDLNQMRLLAISEGNSLNEGVALTMLSFGFLHLTDMFGYIPYSEALSAGDGNFTPTFDSPEAVYTGVLAQLDVANTLLASGEGEINSNTDLLYGGSAAQWQKFANSLKFRALMRISNVSSTSIDISGQLSEIASSRSVFASSDDEAKFDYLTTSPNANPHFETINEGNRTEFRSSDVMIGLLSGDPRLSVYAEENINGEYVGKPAGYDPVPIPGLYDYDLISGLGSLYLEATKPGVFLSYSELMFLMAEAAQRGLISGDDEAFYVEGLGASMAENGISAADFTNFITARPYNGTVRQISEQKWVALFGQGVEAWHEWRRTGYPELEPAEAGVIDEIPSRYAYPSNEALLNPAGYDVAISNQGENSLTTKVWWMN